MKLLPITRAYCAELGRVVSISEARREFLSQNLPRTTFTFFCEDSSCCDINGHRNVLITGVNYKIPAQESEKYKACHFRRDGIHANNCTWNQVVSDEIQSQINGVSHPVKRQKLTDLVTWFDPRLHDFEAATKLVTHPNNLDESRLPTTTHSHVNGDGENRTRDFDRLVDSYIEAKNTLSKEEFDVLKLKIAKKGILFFREYFQQIRISKFENITFGGVRFSRDYGEGFKLVFYDRIENQKINLYISAERMHDYRFARFLRISVDAMRDQNRYAPAYFIGVLQRGKYDGELDVSITHLQHLYLVLRPNT